MNRSLTRARALALLLPAALLAGAYGSQWLGGLYPCEMCYWQRWPHFAALALALVAFVVPPRLPVLLAAVAIAISGGIGVFHAGVEYGWWPGITGCSTVIVGGADPLAEIMAAPVVRCDVPQWSFAGISLAGFNAIISLVGAAVIAVLALGRGR